MKKFIVAAACAVLAAIAGCGRSEPPKPGHIRVGVVAKSLGNGFFDAVNKGAQEAAKELDAEVIFVGPTTPTAEGQIETLNSLIAQRAFPWTRIFMDFESNLPAGVRIVSIEPRLVDNYVQLRLTVGAADDVSKLEFLRRLEESAPFSHIQVEGERRSAAATGGPGEIVMLLQARYSVG